MTDDMENPREATETTETAAKKPEMARLITVKIGVKPGYVLRKVGEAYMVMPTGPRMKDYKGMITLNETGAVLFKASQQPNPDFDTLMQALRDEYGVEDDEARVAVNSFVRQCANAGLFEVEIQEVPRNLELEKHLDGE